ncbi:MAG: DNA repair and recombination protein RadB [Candidatus Aenigmarchaeota archaeon]|nr:DNA repair and recombination protein RadB [Candidatus Aenigmarchaeota archaeon]
MDISLPEPLDELLTKLESGAITNFYGAPGTGKTNLCLLLSVECVKKGGKVAYIDTEGGLSVDRLKQVSKDHEKILKNVILAEPRDFYEQGKFIRNLEKEKVDLIILDSSVALYRLEHAEHNSDGKTKKIDKEKTEANKELSKQLSILSNISRDKNIPVIVTTHTYKNWDTGENDVIGGDSIKYWSKAIVFLERTGKDGERRAIIAKHRSQPEGKTVKFVITEDGIKPSGFKIF